MVVDVVNEETIIGLTRNEVAKLLGPPKSWPRNKSIPREKAGYFEYEGFRIWFGFGRTDKASWIELPPFEFFRQ